jgi:dihydroneopterin aldolase
MDTIRITGLELACIVGIRPAERRRRQRVRLTIELYLDLARAAESSRIGLTADYSLVADEIANLLRFREYRLIETATEEIAAMLLGAHQQVKSIAVTLEKPEALRGRALHGSVTIRRERTVPKETVHPFGRELVLLETAEAILSLYLVDPGQSLSRIAERDERRLGWLVSGQLGPDRALYDPHVLGRVLHEPNHGSERVVVFVCSLKAP